MILSELLARHRIKQIQLINFLHRNNISDVLSQKKLSAICTGRIRAKDEEKQIIKMGLHYYGLSDHIINSIDELN